MWESTFELPWNPMRLVQRHGRVDRIGSPHEEVYIWCFLPDQQLDDMLGLEERIRTKLAQAAASIGVESEVIPKGARSEVVFADTKTEIEAIRMGDASIFENAGEDPSAHSGEEYRQDLMKGLKERGEEIRDLPWAAGSGFRGTEWNGCFYCAKVGDRTFMRFVPSEKNEMVRDSLECLKRICCEPDTERHLDERLTDKLYDGWAKARKDIFDEWKKATDPKNLHPNIRKLFRNVAEHLRKHHPEGISQDELDDAIESIEAPWGMRIERQIREVFDGEYESEKERSKAILSKVKELGLQPFKPPEPLPEIEEEEVVLVCWMMVS